MTNWMRRRIERSRARCDRAANNRKTDKAPQAPTPQAGQQTQAVQSES